MATTVQQVYNDVCRVLLEDGGLVYCYTEQAFLRDLLVSIRDLLQRTGIVKSSETIKTISGTSEYTTSAGVSAIDAVFVDKRYLQPSSGFYLDNAKREWAAESGFPEEWRQDRLAVDKFQLSPTPDFTGAVLPGTSNNITLIESVIPSATSITMSENIPLMPDTMAAYLKFAVLEKIFSTDGDTKDVQRARYCHARVQECVNLFKSIMQEEILEEVPSR